MMRLLAILLLLCLPCVAQGAATTPWLINLYTNTTDLAAHASPLNNYKVMAVGNLDGAQLYFATNTVTGTNTTTRIASALTAGWSWELIASMDTTNGVPTTRNINTTAPLAGGGDLSADLTLSIPVASSTTNGYLSSTDWSTFNGKVSTSRSISTTSPLAGGGDLSIDRTLSIPVATSSVNGYLSSNDWSTFNGKSSFTGTSGTVINTGTPAVGNVPAYSDTTGTNVAPSSALTLTGTNAAFKGNLTANGGAFTNSLTLGGTAVVLQSRSIATTSPLAGGGDLSADRTFSIQVGTAGQNGYISSTDWSTFNSKVSATRAINTGAGLSGGGDLSTDRTLTWAPETRVNSITLFDGSQASRTETIDLSGTDPVWTYTSGVVNLSTGALQVGGVAVSTATGANPSASVGLSAVNGSAATWTRSDGAPALSQSIVPTWTGQHTFSSGFLLNSGTVSAPSFAFSGATNTGLFNRFSTALTYATGGHSYIELNSNGLKLSSVTSLTWVNNFVDSGSADTVLNRTSAGVLQVLDGGTTTKHLKVDLLATGAVASTISSAATIAPTSRVSFISGTTGIDTITAPSPISLTGGQITLIPTGLWTTSTSGNIALGTTAVVSKALIMTYDQGTAKWYPSY